MASLGFRNKGEGQSLMSRASTASIISSDGLGVGEETGQRVGATEENSLEADQLRHPPLCEASADIFRQERAINFKDDVWRSNVERR